MFYGMPGHVNNICQGVVFKKDVVPQAIAPPAGGAMAEDQEDRRGGLQDLPLCRPYRLN
jgi:hypothetical protein